MTTKIAARAKVEPALREEWLDTVAGLQGQIKAWADQEPGWAFTAQEERRIKESALGEYSVPVWKIQTPDGEVRLEPIARNYPGRGIVELYAWPTLYRVRLIRDEEWGGWRVRTDSGIYLRQEWSRENFITLTNDLLTADA